MVVCDLACALLEPLGMLHLQSGGEGRGGAGQEGSQEGEAEGEGDGGGGAAGGGRREGGGRGGGAPRGGGAQALRGVAAFLSDKLLYLVIMISTELLHLNCSKLSKCISIIFSQSHKFRLPAHSLKSSSRALITSGKTYD